MFLFPKTSKIKKRYRHSSIMGAAKQEPKITGSSPQKFLASVICWINLSINLACGVEKREIKINLTRKWIKAIARRNKTA
jgi:hypothetical protein